MTTGCALERMWARRWGIRITAPAGAVRQRAGDRYPLASRPFRGGIAWPPMGFGGGRDPVHGFLCSFDSSSPSGRIRRAPAPLLRPRWSDPLGGGSRRRNSTKRAPRRCSVTCTVEGGVPSVLYCQGAPAGAIRDPDRCSWNRPGIVAEGRGPEEEYVIPRQVGGSRGEGVTVVAGGACWTGHEAVGGYDAEDRSVDLNPSMRRSAGIGTKRPSAVDRARCAQTAGSVRVAATLACEGISICGLGAGVTAPTRPCRFPLEDITCRRLSRSSWQSTIVLRYCMPMNSGFPSG